MWFFHPEKIKEDTDVKSIDVFFSYFFK
jgi:hypothetical protein